MYEKSRLEFQFSLVTCYHHNIRMCSVCCQLVNFSSQACQHVLHYQSLDTLCSSDQHKYIHDIVHLLFFPQVEFAPDLCSRVTFVNFTVTRSSLQTQCLNQVLKAERPDVDAKRSDLLKLQGTLERNPICLYTPKGRRAYNL